MLHEVWLKVMGIAVVIFGAAIISLQTMPAYRSSPSALDELSDDEYFMVMAFAEIGKMDRREGWPVGAVVVRNGQVIGRGSNMLFASNNPTQHAEYIAIDQAVKTAQSEYPEEKYPDFFRDSTVYVTLEPCPMDAGKIIMLQFKRVVVCDRDEAWGTFGSVNTLQGYPKNVDFSFSELELCKNLRAKEGWNYDELWEIGRQYAQATGQVPSKLEFWWKKLILDLRGI